MKRLQIIAILLFGLLLATPVHPTQRNLSVKASNAQAQKRVALVIGNAKYQGAPALRNPVNDAHAMSNALNALGFEVIEVTDATQKEMNRAITAFGEKLTTDTAALFFYAGHGMQARGKNYIIPVDAQIESEAAVATEAVSVDAVLEQLNASPVSIVILDACRNNPFERSFRKMGGGGLAQMDAPKGSFIAYATAPGKTAADGDGKHGLFTQELLKQIDEPGLDLEKVFKRVRASVAAKSGDAQMPWDSSSMTGDFYFKPGKGSQVASLEPVPAPMVVTNVPVTNDAEGLLWQAAEDSGAEEDVRTYLRQYPNGRYVAQANARIQQFADDAAQAIAQKEPEAWQTATKTNTEEGYQEYLKTYPTGKYVVLVTGRMDKLMNDQAAKAEAELWKKADSSNDRTAVENYLNTYPSGRYVASASEKLKAIKEEEAKGPVMVRIPGRNYEMGKFDVTRGEFAKFVNETGYDAGNECYIWTGGAWDKRSGSNWRNPGFSQDDTHPVACVNWNDAQAYISWLSRKSGKQYRLPTEAEWEYACYGGSQTEYCGGNNINAVAWYSENSGKQTHPAGQKQANGYGLYDMSGNVWQWMQDWSDNSQQYRVIRGGSWNNDPQLVRSASRGGNAPAARYGVGFRLARTLP